MSTRKKPIRGRPPGSGEQEHLLHVRISDAMKTGLESIRERRLDSPNLSALVREALAQYIERNQR